MRPLNQYKVEHSCCRCSLLTRLRRHRQPVESSTAAFVHGNYGRKGEKKKRLANDAGSSQKTLSPDLDERRVLGSCHVHPRPRWGDTWQKRDLLTLDALQRSGWTDPGWNAFENCSVPDQAIKVAFVCS